MSREKYFTEEQVDEIVSRMAAKLAVPVISIGDGDVPIGMKGFFDAIVAPPGWLVADGSVYNIEDYPELATHYASVHGAANCYGGNGTTTFAVPDWRGEFFRAAGTNAHENQGNGANVGVHQDGTEHVSISVSSDTVFGYSGSGEMTEQNKDSVIGTRTGKYTGTGNTSNSYTTYYTSRPTNTSLLCCVKAVPSGHRYSTKEQVVGTWIDGKPIYEKTILYTCPVTSSRTYREIATMSNIDALVNGYGYFIEGSMKKQIPYADSSTAGLTISYGYPNSTSLSLVAKGIGDSTTGACPCYVTIQYTKTTD